MAVLICRVASFALALELVVFAMAAKAAETATSDLVDRSVLRVCADPNNLPFSNDAGEGFENKIAELFADELGVPLEYTYYPDTMGFVRNTLGARRCDLVIGVASGNELVQNTNPYYTSTYALVYRAESGLDVASLDDPALEDFRIGAVARTPPVTVLAKRGLLKNMKPYRLMVDTRHELPARDLVEDVAAGEIDVGVVWGPIAGYWAKQQDVPMKVVPLVGDASGPGFAFRISMGLRRGEPDWKDRLNQLIDVEQEAINRILTDYGVPLLDRRGRLIEPGDAQGEETPAR